MEFDKVIKKREAVRDFKNTKISKEDLNKILEAGRLAPTAKNNQPQKIYVIESLEGLSKVDEITKCRYNAPTVLLVCSDSEKGFEKGLFNTYIMDATIVATHMMLEATNLGIDNIWIEAFDIEETQKKFNLPKNIVPVMLLPLGYRTDNYPGNPLHNIRKELSETIEYI